VFKLLNLSPDALWKLRFRVPTIASAQIARSNPKRGMVISSETGQYHLYAWKLPENELRQLTFQPGGVGFGTLLPDGRYVYYLQDDNGNEIGHFVRVPWEGGTPENVTPSWPLYSAFGLNFSRTGNLLGSVFSNDSGFHAVIIPVAQDGKISTPVEFHHTDKLMFGPFLSATGENAVIISTERTTYQYNILLAFDLVHGCRMSELAEAGAGLMAFGFSPVPGDLRLIGTSTGTGYNRPFIWDLHTDRREDIYLPDFEGDVTISDWSEDGNRILLARNYLAVQQLAIYDLNQKTLTRLNHPAGFYGMGTPFAPAVYFFGPELLACWQDYTHPPQLIALDHTGRKTRTVLPAGEASSGHPTKSITFLSSDGEKIQGWLALPEGSGPFPTILHLHGGPETQTVEYFMPNAQAWLDHGFAWLAINYRGSTGFGRAFREIIWGHIGHWEIEDMVAARNWLIKEGIADPDRIILHGWSYGGYLTLLALGKHPDVWAAGLAGTATVDWAMEYDDLSPAMRGYSVALLGSTPQQKPAEYAAVSPINYIDRIKAPVLIIQGRNDTRTPARPVEVYEKKMREFGKEIEVHWYNEGHSGGGVEQEIEHQEIMMRFIYKVIGR
jgi:dienelactone hydrolase